MGRPAFAPCGPCHRGRQAFDGLPETICHVPEAGKDNRHQPCHKNKRRKRFLFPFHARGVKPDSDPIAD